MVKVFGEDTALVTTLGDITKGIGFEQIPIEGTIPTLGSSVEISFTPVLLAASFDNQSPVALDTPIQISFGAPQSNAFIDLDAAGTVTFLQEGTYRIEVRATIGRTANPGTARVFARSTLNGTQVGNSFHAVLPNEDSESSQYAATTITANANDEFLLQLFRDSSGANFGGLFSQSPTTVAWNDSPSAQITIFRVTGQVV